MHLVVGLLLFAASTKLAPFERVDFEGDRVLVLVNRRAYVLRAVDGVETEKLLAQCKQRSKKAWRTQFRLHLVDVLSAVRGKAPGETVSLVLDALRSGERVVIEQAPLTRAHWRKLFWQQQGFGAPKPPPNLERKLSREDAQADIAQLDRALRDRYAYFDWKKRDRKPLTIRRETKSVTVAELTRMIGRWMAPFGDPNTRVVGLRDALKGRFLPFTIRPAGKGYVALNGNRLMNPLAPYARALDARRPEEWVRAARLYIPHGTDAFVRTEGLAYLQQIEALRPMFNAKKSGSVWLTLMSADREVRLRMEYRLSPAPPSNPEASKPEIRILEGGVGYLPLPHMESEEAFDRHIAPMLARLRETKAAVLDLRGNASSSRTLVRVLLPRLLRETTVYNVARYRRGEEEDPDGYLDDFYLYPRDARRWTDAQRAAIDAFRAKFQPAWSVDDKSFSRLHYGVAGPGERTYGKPVAVLVDGGTRNAAEVMAFALQRAGRAIVVGEATGGSDGRPVNLALRNSGIRISLSSVVSYRPDGKLYLGTGVTPDEQCERDPIDWTGTSDAQLARALARLK